MYQLTAGPSVHKLHGFDQLLNYQTNKLTNDLKDDLTGLGNL